MWEMGVAWPQFFYILIKKTFDTSKAEKNVVKLISILRVSRNNTSNKSLIIQSKLYFSMENLISIEKSFLSFIQSFQIHF